MTPSTLNQHLEAEFEFREQAYDRGRQVSGCSVRDAEIEAAWFGPYDFCFWAGYYEEPWNTIWNETIEAEVASC